MSTLTYVYFSKQLSKAVKKSMKGYYQTAGLP